jgi:hypothetical protein
MRWPAEWPDLTVHSPKACAILIWERFPGLQGLCAGRIKYWNYWYFWLRNSPQLSAFAALL